MECTKRGKAPIPEGEQSVSNARSEAVGRRSNKLLPYWGGWGLPSEHILRSGVQRGGGAEKESERPGGGELRRFSTSPAKSLDTDCRPPPRVDKALPSLPFRDLLRVKRAQLPQEDSAAAWAVRVGNAGSSTPYVCPWPLAARTQDPGVFVFDAPFRSLEKSSQATRIYGSWDLRLIPVTTGNLQYWIHGQLEFGHAGNLAASVAPGKFNERHKPGLTFFIGTPRCLHLPSSA
ncbi:hypothetical protein N7468_006872 [Penicillium chermesinum]|uniref:Uncharacterized protein n=1 Tax=Penicillium chermesinum TaxID=63820 RepID=A0A9W9TK03_9EURO|nr:uncharacterized protein N7468_006872 [Penicillium chermesinum]KAJ5225647.1 hypothetical protein N7468_006872 [Penicillium chermesinum]